MRELAATPMVSRNFVLAAPDLVWQEINNILDICD
jgi:hypothetical protein